MKIISIFLLLLLSGTVAAQNWMPIADFGAVGRHRASAFSIGHKGYAGIGHKNGTGLNIVFSDWWEYDPASNSWTQKADYANGVGNYGAISFATDTHGYIGGGTAFTSEYYEYDPITNTWTIIAACPVNANDQTAFSVNNKGYVIDNSNLVEYDPATDVWTMKQPIPFGINIWSSSFVADETAYVKSGSTFYQYKPSVDTWIPRASFPGIATSGCSAFSIHKKGYVVTGYSGSLANVTNEVWEYNPASNTWIQLNDFEGSSRRFSVAFTVNDRGYIGTGTNGINFNDFWAFDSHFAELNELSVDFSVFPNPSTAEIHFKTDQQISNESTLYIFDSNGKTICNAKFEGQEYTWLRTNENSGTYFYRLKSNDKWSAQGTFQLTDL